MCSGSMACSGVVELKRGIDTCEPYRGGGTAGQLIGAARAAARRAPPRPARRSLCRAVDYFLLDSFVNATGAFPVGLDAA